MQKFMCALGMLLFSQLSVADSKVTYLACPELDSRFSDLKVVIDQPNGTAALQSESAGSGLNFSAPASFGPEQVSWRKESGDLSQKFSVNRVSLVLVRETTSTLTGKVYTEKSNCSVVQAPDNRKF